jgi:hypothetical protein
MGTLVEFATPVKVVRAAMLDGDSIPDLLVGLDTTVVRILRGPGGRMDTISILVEVQRQEYMGPIDTILVPGWIRDIEVSQDDRTFWIGYTASVALHPWYNETIYKSLGGLRRFDAVADSGSEMLRYNGTFDLAMGPVDADSQHSIVAFWGYSYRDMIQTGPDWILTRSGTATFGEAGDTIAFDTIFDFRSVDFPVFIEVPYPIAVADLSGGGLLEFVYASHTEWYETDGRPRWSYETTAYSLDTGDSLWSTEGVWPSSIWELTGDGLPDVLVHKGCQNIGFRGSTGDSLFAVTTEYRLYPQVTGTLDTTGIRRGVVRKADTLIVFHLDFETVDVRDEAGVPPASFALLPNYPNPFNASTRIAYDLAQPAVVSLAIFDALGRHVRTLARAPQPAGQHSVTWDGFNKSGRAVASGVYLLRLSVGDETETRKVLLLK